MPAPPGADACLVVTPYYNKATQRGLIAHYTAIADASDRPVILYNVPSRTGCNLLPETCAALAAHPRIAAVKEASGNLSQIVSLFHRAAACLDVYSGNDDQIVPILAMGGEGCISVLSNVLPREAVQLCELFFSGDVRGAAALQCRLLPSSMRCFPRSIPFRSRRRWQKWATAPTRCVCRSPRWRKEAGPSF